MKASCVRELGGRRVHEQDTLRNALTRRGEVHIDLRIGGQITISFGQRPTDRPPRTLVRL